MVTRIGALLIAVAIASSATPSATAQVSECPDMAMFGVAGSGQTPGMGRQVRGVVDELSDRLASSGRTTSVQPIDYPAVDLVRTFGLAWFDGRYEESVATGAVHLVEAVSGQVERCPDSVIVIVGYSQGAQVVKAAASALPLEARIGAIVVLADPTSDPAQRGVFRIGATQRGDSGWLGAAPIPERIRAATIEVCAPGDIVCGGGRLRLGAHANGYEGPLIDRVAAVAALWASAARVFWWWF